LVLLNSLVTVVGYAPLVELMGFLVGARSGVGFPTVLAKVAIYLGIPLATGLLMWALGHKREWYWSTFLPRFAPVGLLSLLWTCLIMFCEKSKSLTSGDVAIADVLLVALPLILYFSVMFGSSWVLARWVLRVDYAQTVTFAFTAAGNNFELALAACTAIFGTASRQAAATVIGPLLEIPVMLLLVTLSKRLRYGERVPGASAQDDRST